MSYIPPNRSVRLGDTWEYSDGDRVHAFFLQYQQDGFPPAGREFGGIGHAVSRDLLRWETLPSALYTGIAGSYDDLELWTGCTVREKGKLWLYYTSRSSTGYMQGVSAATSEDGIHFSKLKENPLLVPDSTFYYSKENPCPYLMHGNNGVNTYDCRDFCVVRDPEEDCWWGFFAARQPADECPKTSVIGLAKSSDLIHWTQCPPCFAPNRYHCVETPDVFYMDGKWVMLCLAGNIYGQRTAGSDDFAYPLITIYAVADRLQGPYHEADDSLLLATAAPSGNCAKTVLHKGKRYLFHVEQLLRKDGSSEMGMSLPKVVQTDAKGRLFAGLYDGYSDYFTETIRLAELGFLQKGGNWGSPGRFDRQDDCVAIACQTDWCLQPFAASFDNFILEADIGRESAESAGFAFGLGANVMEGGYVLLLDYTKNRVYLTGSRTFVFYDGRSWDLSGESCHLTLVCAGNTVEAYLDGRLAINHLLEGVAGRPALFVEKGRAHFANVAIHRMKPFNE